MEGATTDLELLAKQTALLSDILLSRLPWWIHCHIQDESKHDHYVWDWVRKNIGRVAVIMILLDLVIDVLEIALQLDGIGLLKLMPMCLRLRAAASKGRWASTVVLVVSSLIILLVFLFCGKLF